MKNDFNFETLVAPGVQAFEFWISFFPTAPLFGVDWRFAEMVHERTADSDSFEEPVAKDTETSDEVPAEAAVADAVMSPPDAAPVENVEDIDIGADVAEEPAETGTAAVSAVEFEIGEESLKTDEPLSAVEPGSAMPANLFDARPDDADDLKLIKGIGPGLEKQLNVLGVYRFDQIAGFSEGNLAWIDERLTSFKGRCFRDDWIGQAVLKLN